MKEKICKFICKITFDKICLKWCTKIIVVLINSTKEFYMYNKTNNIN